MKLSLERIETIFRKLLPYWLIFLFFATVVQGYYSYKSHNAWTMGDWLINYKGGFVRRGLLGELIYNLSQFFSLSPGLITLITQLTFYLIFFLFSYLLIKKQAKILPLTLLIFSPFIFAYQVNNPDGGFRKEILFFALLSFLIWLRRSLPSIFETVFPPISFISFPLLILSHEMLVVFIPYIFVVYLYSKKLDRKVLVSSTFLALISIVTFCLIIKYGVANRVIVEKIRDSLKEGGYPIPWVPRYGGAIGWLDKDYKFGFKILKQMNIINYIFVYLKALGLCLVGFFPLYPRIKSLFKDKVVTILIMVSLLWTLGLLSVAIDWGRVIYIHLVSFFLLLLLFDEEESYQYISRKISCFSENKLEIGLIILFFIFYTSFWYLYHVVNGIIINEQSNLIKTIKIILRLITS